MRNFGKTPTKLSIITVNLNNAEGLELTIRSVINHNFPVEFLVIDGGSTDGSKTIIENYTKNISYSISEKDNGIYNAMNKGIAKAAGEYILFLNSGDTLLNNNSLQALSDQGNNADIIYGDLIIRDGQISRESVFPDKLSFKFFLVNSLPHPSTLIKRRLFGEIGPYFETLKVVSDWAFFLLAINKYNYSYKHVSVFVSSFSLGGVSSTQLNTIAAERNYILNKFFPTFLDDYKEYDDLLNKWSKARKLFGFRLHNKLLRIFPQNG